MNELTDRLILAATTITAATISYLFGRKKNKSVTDSNIAKAAQDLVTTSQSLMNELKENYHNERKHRADCEEKVQKLEAKVVQFQEDISLLKSNL